MPHVWRLGSPGQGRCENRICGEVGSRSRSVVRSVPHVMIISIETELA